MADLAVWQEPSAEEVMGYFEGLSNWGRWGDDDERGTLNFIKDEHRAAAAKLVKTGRAVSCARDLITAFGDPGASAQMFWAATGECCKKPEGVPNSKFGAGDVDAAVEYIGMVYHGPNITHIDTPAHLFWKGQTYNGKPASRTSAEFGATWCPVTEMSQGVISRGVLLDVPRALGLEAFEPGRSVTPVELQQAADRQGVEVGEGDIVLLRTGRWHPSNFSGNVEKLSDDPKHWHAMSGWHPSCMPWLHARNVATIGSDYAQEAMPGAYPGIEMGGTIHVISLVAMGLPLIDNCDLEALADACIEHDRWEFQFTLAPLRLVGASGAPINPIAIF